MKKPRTKIDARTSSILDSIADANDDPAVIAELADVDPNDFRKFVAESAEPIDEAARQLLRAVEAPPHETTENIAHYRTGGGATILTGFTDPGVFVNRVGPFRLLMILYLGMGLSLSYGLLGSSLILYFGSSSEAQAFLTAYTSSFKTVFSLGLILGTALIVFRTQTTIPKTIEAGLKGYLSAEYYFYKRRFSSLRLSLTLSMEMVVVAFVIFSYCQFPMSKRGTIFMLIAACSEYALGAYVIRKLMYAGLMLYSLLTATITRNLFRTRELDAVSTYVQLISMLALICVCVHVIGYYRGPFVSGSIFGASIKTFLLLPAIAATPLLLILNFYPRLVLRKLYSQSIDVERMEFRNRLEVSDLRAFEKTYYLIEFEKMSSNELRSHSQLTIGDLLLGISVLVMILGLFFWR